MDRITAIPAPILVIGGMLGLQGGAALAAGLFPVVGIAGVVALRLAAAAVVLCAIWRPWRQWRDLRPQLPACLAAGTLLALHHLSYYMAVARVPLGEATTVEFTGPFLIAVLSARRLRPAAWAVLALTGVGLLGGAATGSRSGLVFAAAAGACWAGYILVSARLAKHTAGGQPLAIAITWAALLVLPYGLISGGTRLLHPHVAAIGILVGILSSVLPYTANLEALRRITPRAFGVLTSLEGAIGAGIGWIFLGQHLTPLQCAGIAAVVTAAAGSTLTTSESITEGSIT
jgi:inner membrane transporter RhtA